MLLFYQVDVRKDTLDVIMRLQSFFLEGAGEGFDSHGPVPPGRFASAAFA